MSCSTIKCLANNELVRENPMNRSRFFVDPAAALLAFAALAGVALAQPATDQSKRNTKPKLNLAQEFGDFSALGGLGGGSDKHVTLVGSFTVEKGSLHGILSVA